MVVENGLGAVDKADADGSIHDAYRIEYAPRRIEEMEDAVFIDGVDPMGYTPWSCIDLVSASTGQAPKRYGFAYVDADDNGPFARRDRFYWYKKALASQGEDL